MPPHLSAPLLAAAVLAVLLVRLLAPRPRNLPPGPPGLPILGNLLQLPRRDQPKHFAAWGRQYGPVTYVDAMGQPIVLLSTAEAAHDLLEARAAIYSDRPQHLMIDELAGFGKALTFLPFGARFRKSRRLLQSAFSQRLLRHYQTFQERAAHALIADILAQPAAADLETHVRKNVVAVIAMIAYGYTVQPRGDEFVRILRKGIAHLAEAGLPGRFLVDYLPWLKYLPAWAPGARFKRLAAAWRPDVDAMIDVPWARVKAEVAQGTAEASLAACLLTSGPRDADDDDLRKWAVGSLFGAGSDTTVSVLMTFFLCMTLYPDAQRAAQAELDAVCPARLPTFADRARLPFLGALVKELLRYHPVVELAVHRVTQDDVYRGHHIPRGAYAILNVWALSRDERVYPDPDRFDPARFLGAHPAPDPRKFVFGHGRRVCPGAQLAEAAVFIAAASVLAVFAIGKARAPDGSEVTPAGAYHISVVSHPLPFPCTVTPRSREHEQLVREAARHAGLPA